MICKYCNKDHIEMSKLMYDGKPYLCMELANAMLNMSLAEIRENVDHQLLCHYSMWCSYCKSIHHAWPPCSEELGTTRAPTSSPAPVTSSPAPVTSSPAPVTSSPAPKKPGCLHITLSSTELEIRDGVTILHKPALRAEVRDETGGLLADCICQDEQTAINAATQAGIAVWRATR